MKKIELKFLVRQNKLFFKVIQERPTGVSQLVDGLSSSNEVLRNASLLLLIAVSESNPILQKIIAFENGFEILLNVAGSEGG